MNKNKNNNNLENQRLINRAILLTVFFLEKKGLRYGRTRLCSVLKGHNFKHIFENNLSTLSTYGILMNIEYADIYNQLNILIQNNYIEEKNAEMNDLKYADKQNKALYITKKGKAKAMTLNENFPNLDKDYKKQDLNLKQIAEIIYKNKGDNKAVFNTERRLKIVHLYFTQSMTLQEIGELFSLTRERIRQIISKEIKKIFRFNAIKDDIKKISFLLNEGHTIDEIINQQFGDIGNKEMYDTYRKLIRYIINLKKLL